MIPPNILEYGDQASQPNSSYSLIIRGKWSKDTYLGVIYNQVVRYDAH